MKRIVLFIIAILLTTTAFPQCWSKLGGGGDYFVALKTDGSLWGWGNNNYGQLANGSFSGTSTSPTQIGTGTSWSTISGGDQHILALKNDGTLWAWGYNFWGQLGNANTVNLSAVTMVGTDNNWLQAVAGGNNSFALKTNGKIYAWGHNGYGQHGNGTTSATQVLILPTQVGTDSNWAQIAGGSGHCMALKSNGTLWGWGYNTTGQVGVNSTSNVLVPTQVGTDSDWAKVFCGDAHTFAIKTNGSLWAWGTNNYGQLGNGNTTNQLTPVLIDTLHAWANIIGGSSHTLAVTTNGDLYVCGYNGYGALGNGTTVALNTLTQIGTGSSWSHVGAGWYFSEAIKSDGTAWGWGKNNYGQTGSGTSGGNVLLPASVNSIGCTPTEIQFVEQQDILVYPNPSRVDEQVVISSKLPFQEVLIFNLHGELVYKQLDSKKSLELHHLPEGMYVLKIKTNQSVQTRKLIRTK